MAKEKKERRNLWNFVEALEGDKVVWMIVFLLILISIVAISSSTSMLAVQQGTSRMEIISDQLKISLVGLLVIIVCYNIKKIAIFRAFSQLGFAVSRRPAGPCLRGSQGRNGHVPGMGGDRAQERQVPDS